MSFPARVAVALLRAYRRFVSPLMGRHCRYEPTCSAYATEAIARWGALRGSVLAVRRVARCHPFAPGGFDPVPRPDASHPGVDTSGAGGRRVTP
jgi:uncharacterized protein